MLLDGQEHPFRARERLGEIWPLTGEAFRLVGKVASEGQKPLEEPPKAF